MTESKSLRMKLTPEFIEAGARSLAGDFDYLSQWDKMPPTGTNYTRDYWRELFTRAVEAALTATAPSGSAVKPCNHDDDPFFAKNPVHEKGNDADS